MWGIFTNVWEIPVGPTEKSGKLQQLAELERFGV
jgi:hypothetical protein